MVISVEVCNNLMSSLTLQERCEAARVDVVDGVARGIGGTETGTRLESTSAPSMRRARILFSGAGRPVIAGVARVVNNFLVAATPR
jgi:hypothetical protein